MTANNHPFGSPVYTQMGSTNNTGAGGAWSPPSGPSLTRDSMNPAVYGVPLQSMSIPQSILYHYFNLLLQEAYHPTTGTDQVPPGITGGFTTIATQCAPPSPHKVS